jgi:outer membrane protein insertion porin family
LIKKGDTYSNYLITRSLKNIKSLGQFSKVSKLIDNDTLTITVEEYPVIDAIVFEGNTLFPSSELTEELESSVTSVNNLNSVRNDIKLLNRKYEENGYLKAKVIQVVNPTDENHTLTFIVKEGVLDSFTITGNVKTKDYVIIREIQLEPGKPLNQDELKKSLRRVFNLNYFTDVYPEIVEGDTPNSEKVIFNITEKETSGSFSFGGGYNPTAGFSLFSDLNWDNVAGTGRTIMLKSSFGLGSADQSDVSNATYQFKYRDPWAFGEHRSFAFRTWRTTGSFVTNPLDTSSAYSVWDENRIGFDMTFGIPHTYDLRTSHKYKYENVNLPEATDNDGNDLAEETYDIYSYTFGVSYDTRDYFMNPTNGIYNTFSIEQGLKFRTDAINFTKFDLGLRQFVPITKAKNQILAMRAEVGAMLSPDLDTSDSSTERIFSSQEYYVGGANTVRGYSDKVPFAHGYKRLLFNLEYRYIFSQMFQMIGFIDTGNAVDSFSDLTNFSNFRIGKGIGVRILVPGLGPIRIDYGFGDNQNVDSGNFVHFSIGHVF